MKLCGLVPNYYIHESVSELYIPRIGHRYMNVDIGRQNKKNSILKNNEAEQFHFWEHINQKQTFIYWILTGPSFAV
jgi:hypothetical protein